ncbi:MAG TPA: bifunctional diaminohydroxyphosphoribosylaminopyrimidine deaminase/5-amino-6-(5-phosphoribosylamino)uracil reductase RibD [Chryseolinea sp.]|nr:bifunctional diaminohydroxyphosphoribosylaminopyrimidine deaminase/5-amino-6-(5-phosphoribosylamino)uracil reductase RibD [Chryseolinea sp.]HPH45665.1 bifunctional diaminohydroxyphosphoribosylaminopyrimidine deaminase/5-amino-6-(5-phosphoribosylamino)uracil reductase RibD [Chryseolinea sp.]HPM29294.1 bifunctional diaminohydroxyphosphoribosylaminopyrimidine deaminase/5-amino-6-(5-phosphoribosylamino)uracil reductase RibD [Chryseolinea sp.]
MTKHDHSTDELFMHRALELAALGRGMVSPNPMVGCVVVHNDHIIGEGFHRQYGGPHAEVNAIESVEDKSLLKESTLYVNLEPCSHEGKTPPCADLLIHHNVKKVVVSNLDSNPLVAGEGIKKLRTKGIKVITGVLEKEGREFNRRFFTYIEKQRPYIILKWAETADGFIARENFDSKWISNEHSRQLVHKWRTEEDAVLVGSKTTAHDNPKLNVRDWTGRNPTRIVIDRFLKLSDRLHLFDKSQKTICYNLIKHEEHPNLSLIRLDEENFLENMMRDLTKLKIQSIIIEGGAQTLSHFIETNLWDEARTFISQKTFTKGIQAPVLHGNLVSHESILNDTLKIYHPS